MVWASEWVQGAREARQGAMSAAVVGHLPGAGGWEDEAGWMDVMRGAGPEGGVS